MGFALISDPQVRFPGFCLDFAYKRAQNDKIALISEDQKIYFPKIGLKVLLSDLKQYSESNEARISPLEH